ASREMWSMNSIETLIQDMRYGARMLMKNPGFTLIAVLTLTLGIGANTAIFSVVNGVLLRPLPYHEPERLVMVWADRPILQARTGLPDFPVAVADYVDWRDQNRVFEQMAALEHRRMNLTGGGEPESVNSLRVSASLFPLLGARFAAGRAFSPEEDRAGADRVVIISHRLWRQRYGADPKIIGQKITLDNEAYSVVGVAAPDFQFPRIGEIPYFWGATKVDFYLPIAFTPAEMKNRGEDNLMVIARLKSGVSLGQAGAEMSAIARRLTEQYPRTNTDKGVRLAPLQQQMVGKAQTALLMLLGAVGFVLLIACANVANLLLARAAGRGKEMAIRAALGASRGRVVRQLLTESVLLAISGGAAGLLLAWRGVELLLAIAPDNLPRAYDIRLDTRVAGFTLLVSLLTGIVFGLLPALQASKIDLGAMLKEGGRDAAGLLRRRLRGLMVVGEVALAFVLLIGAGLLIRSFAQLTEVNPGIDPHRVLTMEIVLPTAKYSYSQIAPFFQQTLERVRALPGIEEAATVHPLPLGGGHVSAGFDIEGRPEEPIPFNAGLRFISPDFFKTFRVPLVNGRLLAENDGDKAPPVVVVNESLARNYFASEDPLGKRIIYDGLARSIVGIVGDVKHSALDKETKPEIYFPMAQVTRRTMSLAVRTSGDPLQMVAAVRGQVWALDRDQPIYNIQTMEQLMARAVAPRRFNMLLLSLFALVGLALAAVGLYGVLSYTVTQRTHEIGVRMALGAQRDDVLRLVIGEGMKLAFIGALIGLGGALALTRLLKTLLFDVSATDPLTFIVIAALLIIVALLACWIPARRAASMDPLVSLRVE
ncbi:MAG TPA: ABC transporter permease, partial [Blastocatellia bacterium]